MLQLLTRPNSPLCLAKRCCDMIQAGREEGVPSHSHPFIVRSAPLLSRSGIADCHSHRARSTHFLTALRRSHRVTPSSIVIFQRNSHAHSSVKKSVWVTTIVNPCVKICRQNIDPKGRRRFNEVLAPFPPSFRWRTSCSIQMRLVCLPYVFLPPSCFLDPNESLSRSVMASMRAQSR